MGTLVLAILFLAASGVAIFLGYLWYTEKQAHQAAKLTIKQAKATAEQWESKATEFYNAGMKLKAMCQRLQPYTPIADIEGALQQRKNQERALQAEISKLAEKKQADIEQAKRQADEIISKAETEGKSHLDETRQRATEVLEHAHASAHSVIEGAKTQAQEIAGEAYLALENRKEIEKVARAMKNIVKGYGDEYLVPSTSILDDLADQWGHKEAGEQLKVARARSRNMVINHMAAECDYADPSRKDTAISFVIDAFNGRVDAILSNVRHDNFGTMSQKIRDVFSLVNENGKAFRNARIVDRYLEARLDELKWAVAVQELRRIDREEQKRIRDEMREEERVRKEIERAMAEAKKQEDVLQQAMEEARKAMAEASVSQKHDYEMKLAELEQQLHEANEANRRAVSMAQQTKMGHVYIISNIGSFGDDVFKIGMTRRLEPLDRVKELSDASVPFPFDVHAMIHSTNAPALEAELQSHFEEAQLNLVNTRKEFYRVPLSAIRAAVDQRNLDVSWTMRAEALEYRESMAARRKKTAQENEFAADVQADN